MLICVILRELTAHGDKRDERLISLSLSLSSDSSSSDLPDGVCCLLPALTCLTFRESLRQDQLSGAILENGHSNATISEVKGPAGRSRMSSDRAHCACERVCTVLC